MATKAKRIGDLQTVDNTQAHRAAASKYNYIRIQLEDGREIPLLFTDKEIQRAKERAEKNPEDLPKVGALKNFLD